MAWTDTLKPLMRARGLTQKELAELLGTSVGTVSQIITGKRIPSNALASQIADALDVAVKDLVRHEAMVVYHAHEVDLLTRYRHLSKEKKAAIDKLIKVL